MGKSKGKGHKGKSKDGMMAWSNDDVCIMMHMQLCRGKLKPTANVYGMDFWSLEMVSDVGSA